MKCLESNRRGSALLIVLGMMSFIVVSAVAFSAYMRYARLPSSYLRRTSSARLLAKAAVAQAIETIDCAIGNNPYPGVGNDAYAWPRGADNPGPTIQRNYWRDRVYIGQQQPVGTGSTVSTLTLEGLAYIPAPFVNDARYWSRRSTAGAWRTMAFDAGRYAFTAINVSDCFDVNRILADQGRDSSDEGRITLAHCFEGADHRNASAVASKAKAWDKFMTDFVDESHTKVPLVSVADLNLALWDQKPANLPCPFAEYLTSNALFIENPNDHSERDEMVCNMTFVTDGLFPVTNRVSSAINLANKNDQPFAGFRMASNDNNRQNDDTLDDVLNNGSNKFLNKYTNELAGPEVVQLYDYLDRDSVPLSLALPTVERTPMITGVGLEGNLAITVTDPNARLADNIPDPSAVIDPMTGNPKTKFRAYAADLKVNGELQVSAGFVFPFKYDRGTQPTFRAQAAATIVFVAENEAAGLRRQQAKAPAVITRGDWTPSKKNATAVKFGDERAPVVITMMSAPQNLQLPNKVLEEEDAVMNDVLFDFGSVSETLTGDFEAPSLALDLPENVRKGTFRLIEKVNVQTNARVGDPETTTTFRPVNPALNGVIQNMTDGVKYVPVVQVWVRILDANNKVVDLVPACYQDDEQVSQVLPDIARGSRDRPLLRFTPASTADLNLTANIEETMKMGGQQVALSPKAYLADDPRFNYAPENFKTCASLGGEFKTEWFNQQRSGEREGDIFMTTSDAGYLQSHYELANLLDISGIRGENRTTAIDAGAYNGQARADFASTPANGSMWTTYSQFEHNGHRGDLSRFDIINGAKGFRVNPYTEDPNIMMAALANTPLDWWAASTNDVNDSVKQKMLDSLTEAYKYTFSEMSGAQVDVKHGKISNGVAETGTLMELAQKLSNTMRGAPNNWEGAYDNFGWDQEDRIGGVDLNVSLHAVDKKYLYGFWRECFANRQQLFLIFVRAEPAMMGGGGMGQTPPQLGVRAVALVWRDPTPTPVDNGGQPRPHRTRLLFYRQFD